MVETCFIYLVWFEQQTTQNLLILKKKVQFDSMFWNTLIAYLKNIMYCNLIKNNNDIVWWKIELNVFSNVHHLNDDEFNQILLKNSDKMVFMKQMHFVTHNAICFKYKSEQDKCRFDMFKNIVFCSLINEHDVIQIKRNNDWVNFF